MFLFLEQFGSAIGSSSAGLYTFLVVVFMLALWLWIASLNVVVFDLEWMEHLLYLIWAIWMGVHLSRSRAAAPAAATAH